MSASRPHHMPSLVGLCLKDYRKKYDLTQEQLAADLSVDVRTLRRWENGETPLSDINELKCIADRLGIEPDRLGVAASVYLPLTLEQINETIESIWHLVEEARTAEAQLLVDRLVQDLTRQITGENDPLLYKLAQAHHLAGYVKSMRTRANEIVLPLSNYQEMEKIARILHDETLLNIALTYEGDMLCRGGDTVRSIEYLEAARDTTPQAEIAARGNGMQLLARAFLRANRTADFERAMKESEEIAATITPQASSTRSQYSLGTVYEEYGRSYAQLGEMQKAMEYLDKAEASLESTKHWEILIKTARAIALVRGGEIENGVQIAIESAELCKKHGTIRL